jgi:6-pyruvoyltetrahydropterin/6-carboxytetrahydropterin synthase
MVSFNMDNLALEAENLLRVTSTRCFSFSAGHRVFNPLFSEAQNRAVYGVCSLPSGHGHNFQLMVSVRPSSILMAKRGAFFTWVEGFCASELEGSILNEVLLLSGQIPTCENIVVAILPEFQKQATQEGLVVIGLRLEETRNNAVELSLPFEKHGRY